MSEIKDHLKLLSIFHYVVGGLAALFAFFPVIHLGLGIAMLLSPESFNKTDDPPPAFVAWFFIAFAAAFMLAGWTFAALLIYAGRCIAKRKRHLFCLVVAGISTMFMPFGTVLGVFTLIVLLKPEAKKEFGIANDL